MTVNSNAVPNPILPPNYAMDVVEKNRKPTNPLMNLLLGFWRKTNGLSATISCNCTNVGNTYTLTPLDVSPVIPAYYSYWSFAFVASATPSGVASATVVPEKGSLPTLPIYTANGATPAGAADIVSGLFYVIYYVDSLNSGNGGFVLK